MDFILADNNLLIVALAIAGLYTGNAVFQLIRRQDSGAGWLTGLLFFAGAVSAFAILLVHVFVKALPSSPLAILLIVGALELVIGIIMFWVERRRQSFAAERSYGLLTIGLGVFVLVTVFIVPVLPEQLSPPILPAAAALPPTSEATVTLARSATPTRTVTASPSPTVTQMPSVTVTPSATPTRERYNTPTPTPTPTVAAFCGAFVNYNLNFRELPDNDSRIIDTIPYESVVQAAGRSANGEWWFVKYNDRWGWVQGQYMALDATCENAPIIPR
jgi:hypothetical protein